MRFRWVGGLTLAVALGATAFAIAASGGRGPSR
jgi:hypothetical protein